VEKGSVFDLEPAAVQWLAETFEAESPQHALLDSLALSAEPESAPRGMRRVGDGGSLRDLLSEAKVGDIVRDVASAFPDVPIPKRPGRAQLRAIDALVRQGW
jgi:hypothetical protein